MEMSGGTISGTGGIQASLGGRYALALFETAEQGRSIDTIEASLVTLRDALAADKDLVALTKSPVVARGPPSRRSWRSPTRWASTG